MNDREAKKSRWSFMRKKPPPAPKCKHIFLSCYSLLVTCLTGFYLR